MNQPNSKHLDYITEAFRSELFWAIAEGDKNHPLIKLAVELTQLDIQKAKDEYVTFDDSDYTAEDHINLGEEILETLNKLEFK